MDKVMDEYNYEVINKVFDLLHECDFSFKDSIDDTDGVIYLVTYKNPNYNFDVVFNQKTLNIKFIKRKYNNGNYIWKNLNHNTFLNKFNDILLGEVRIIKINQFFYKNII